MVEIGLTRALADERARLAGRRLGLIVNPTSVGSEFAHTADLLVAAGLDVRALLGPEHGVRGDVQYMAGVADARDARTGLPVYSLYGDTEASLTPTPAMLADLDALVFDIQDVGARYYTYVWTLLLAMKAAARAGLEVIVLDRPNPIGGLAADVEGAGIDPGFESFVGLHSVATRHGLTAGEIARLCDAELGLGCKLTVLAMRGWRRGDHWAATGLPWVIPSPNMPSPTTALVYPGMCLLEGTTLSEGRGTTLPFELFGAPWLEPELLAARLGGLGLPGVRFRPCSFRPTWNKHAGELCGGVQLHVHDAATFRPVRTGIAALWAAASLSRERGRGEFSWHTEAYEFVRDRKAIDLLAGSSALREGLDAGASFAALCAPLPAAEAAFRAARAPHLLYPEAAP